MSSENSFKSLHYVKTGIFAFPPLEQGGPEFGRAPRKCLPWRFERPDAVWGTSKEQYFKVLGSQSIWASIDKQRASRLRKKAKHRESARQTRLKVYKSVAETDGTTRRIRNPHDFPQHQHFLSLSVASQWNVTVWPFFKFTEIPRESNFFCDCCRNAISQKDPTNITQLREKRASNF